MTEATKTFLSEQDAKYAMRKKEILNAVDDLNVHGTTYYVSNQGNDANDGLTPETAWKSVNRVNHTWMNPGDCILFRRGDLWRGTEILTKSGISYGAYGSGEKPRFYGWTENLACNCLWECIDDKHHIWKYTKPITDIGTLVFNDGELCSRKLIPSYRNLQFVCRDKEEKPFVMQNEMTMDLDIFCKIDRILCHSTSKGETFPVPCAGREYLGELYLRCDKGNPGDVFSSIEAISRYVAFRVNDAENITIDNICVKYYCFGVSASGHSIGLHVSNCEFGWIGGNIQSYFGMDPNYPEGTRGSVTRFGNAVEIYGGCENYTVNDCYIYQVYDAGITHQVNTSVKQIMKNIRYTRNLIEKCVYGIEYFLDQNDGESESYMENILIQDNIIRLSGYGWGQQRHNYHTPASIKGWSYTNTARNFSICNNIFDRCAYKLLHLVAEKDAFCPTLSENTYIQHLGNMLGRYGGNEIKEPDIKYFTDDVEEVLKQIFKESNPTVYYIK